MSTLSCASGRIFSYSSAICIILLLLHFAKGNSVRSCTDSSYFPFTEDYGATFCKLICFQLIHRKFVYFLLIWCYNQQIERLTIKSQSPISEWYRESCYRPNGMISRASLAALWEKIVYVVTLSVCMVAQISPWHRSAAQASWRHEIWQYYNACLQPVSSPGKQRRLDPKDRHISLH